MNLKRSLYKLLILKTQTLLLGSFIDTPPQTSSRQTETEMERRHYRVDEDDELVDHQ